ncbi:hypothetical protein [Methylobacterium sp. JK268]
MTATQRDPSQARTERGRSAGGAREGTHPSHPVTPDGRYLVVRGRLWRRADPALPEERRRALVGDLMAARRTVKQAKAAADPAALAAARAAVDRAKRALGERGPPYWEDGAPDLNRRMVAGTPYAAWYRGLAGA